MGYTYTGMRIMTFVEVLERYNKGSLEGCYRLYNDGTESMIDRNFGIADIFDHYEKGGQFGEEREDL